MFQLLCNDHDIQLATSIPSNSMLLFQVTSLQHDMHAQMYNVLHMLIEGVLA